MTTLFEDSRQCQVLKALADETRLRIVRLLYREELNVFELGECLKIPQSSVSRNLARLKKSGLVQDRRDANRSFYSLAMESSFIQPMADYIQAVGSSEHPDLERLATCLLKRNSSTIQADSWDEQASKLYNPMTALPALANLSPRGLTVADLGTGTGTMLPVLSQFAKKVYAIDQAPDMLKAAKLRCQELELDNVEIIQSSIANVDKIIESCDAVLMHFVLHQAQNPLAIILQASKILKSGGRIVIVDRQKHDDIAAKKLFGSINLGFKPQQLREWLEEAGLIDISWNTISDVTTPVPVFTISATKK